MKKIVWLFLLAVCCYGAYASKAQGHYTSRMVDKLSPFHAIHVQGNIEVDFMQNPTHTVHASGPQKVLDSASVRVKDNVLEIGFLPSGKQTGPLRVMVTAPALHEVTVSGKGEVHVRGKMQVQDLSVTLKQTGEFSADGLAVHTLDIHAAGQSEADINRLDAHSVVAAADGNAEIDLAGLALTAQLANHGAGEIDAADLRVQKGKASLTGKGDIKISAYEMLEASAFGKGKIKYKGAPIQMQRSGNLKRIVQDNDD